MKSYGAHALHPDASLLCKLGSIAVHAEEMISPTGHGFDKIAMQSLFDDEQVKDWLKDMDALAMLPRKRTLEDVRLAASSKKRDAGRNEGGDRAMARKKKSAVTSTKGGTGGTGAVTNLKGGKLPKGMGPTSKKKKIPGPAVKTPP